MCKDRNSASSVFRGLGIRRFRPRKTKKDLSTVNLDIGGEFPD